MQSGQSEGLEPLGAVVGVPGSRQVAGYVCDRVHEGVCQVPVLVCGAGRSVEVHCRVSLLDALRGVLGHIGDERGGYAGRVSVVVNDCGVFSPGHSGGLRLGEVADDKNVLSREVTRLFGRAVT